MDEVRHEITKEDYDHLASMEAVDRNEELVRRCPSSIRWGYGLYGKGLKEANGKYYIYYICGSSCD